MKKNRCYPKHSYITAYILSIVLFIFSLGPIFIITNEAFYIKMAWSLFMLSFSLVLFIGALILMQYYVIEDGKLSVKSVFGTLISLEISNCKLIVQNLPTYSSWIGVTYDSWLCIYLKNNKLKLFTKGFNNKKKYKRIQIIYSEKNVAVLSQYLKSV